MHDADLIVIGAGPAGMSAAATAADAGMRVLLLDDQPRAGGQIYRNVELNKDTRPWLGATYRDGARFVHALDNHLIVQKFGATVWRLEKGSRVIWSQGDASHISTAPHVLLATGAQERPMPFPGWTLPGVMPVGAAQILMKTSGMLPRDAVLAGSGPLLYLVAAQMIDAGAPPKALVETQTPKMMMAALRHLPKASFAADTLLKGLGLIQKIRNAKVHRYTRATRFRAEITNDGTVAFSFVSGGRAEHVDTALLLTHLGVIASTHMSRSAGIAHHWNSAQRAFQPVADQWGQTNVSGLHVAGDGAGIHGAEAAAQTGRLAALNILHASGKLSKDARNQMSATSQAILWRARAIRPFLDAVYAPPPEFLSPIDETIVCRCEEITAGDIRKTIDQGAVGHREVKTSVRAGMGPCQGRMCDLTIRGVLAAERVPTQIDIKPPRARTPIKPVKLGELALLPLQQEENADSVT